MEQADDPGRTTTAAVVAYYSATAPPGLDDYVGEVQANLRALLGDAVRPRAVATTHTTVIGLDVLAPLLGSGDLPLDLAERAPGDLHGFCRRLRSLVDSHDAGIRFGGFGDEDGSFSSRGQRLHHRMLGADRGQVVLVGWPVDQAGRATTMLARWRAELVGFGVRHRYPLPDPDAHMVVAELDPAVDADLLTRSLDTLRARLAAYSCFVPVRRENLSVVVYDDPRLPLATTRALPLGRLLGEA